MRVSWCDSALMMEYTATCDRLWWLKSRTVMPWKICCKAVAGKQTGKNKMPNEIKFVSILCLSSRTTVMSACIPEKDAYYHARKHGCFLTRFPRILFVFSSLSPVNGMTYCDIGSNGAIPTGQRKAILGKGPNYHSLFLPFPSFLQSSFFLSPTIHLRSPDAKTSYTIRYSSMWSDVNQWYLHMPSADATAQS